ncbi:hypothetical protein AGMMS49925_09260 [Deltaproteobacteria bacterium]|nr:hypothetical protein AGMMS49925_09260 [Deltaproteobacteria bacterium]
MDHQHSQKPRRILRDVVSNIDRDILRLLVRRHNLITRMYNSKGFLDASEEKFLRASWEAAVSRVSHDPRLSGHLFALMQDAEFLPRPDVHTDDDGEKKATESRPAFNLAPAQKPVRLVMRAPLSCRATRACLMLAAASGAPAHFAPCLMNDPVIDCVKVLNQAGAALTRKDDGVSAREAAPLGVPDRTLHVGDSAWNLYMLLGHYLGRPSRAKFTGEISLKLADLSAVRRFLSVMNARLVHVIPKSSGLPIRLECTGILPEIVALPADVPPELGEGILLAAPLYAAPFVLDLVRHPQRQLMLDRTLPLLLAAGADIAVEGSRVSVAPGPLRPPGQSALPMEPELALFLLALPLALAGEVRLEGRWSQQPQALAGLRLLESFGLDLLRMEDAICARPAARAVNVRLAELPRDFPSEWTPLPVALAACVALQNGKAALPALPPEADPAIATEMLSFLNAVGLETADGGNLCKKTQLALTPWNTPTPLWALALALAACARPHIKLGNPGIVTDLYPAFWALYNALPAPAAKAADARPAADERVRRRVTTDIAAHIPKPDDERIE